MTTLGARLRAFRQQAGLTQRSLADGLVSKSMISQIESDKVQPSPDLLRALALRLGVTVEQLLPAKLMDRERLARYRQAQAFLSLSHPEDALPLLIDCLHSPHPTWSLVEISDQIAQCLHQLHRDEEARLADLETIRLARKENATAEVVRAYLRLAELARAGDLSLALQELKLAEQEMQAAERAWEAEWADELHLQLAKLYQELGRHEEAVRYFEKAHPEAKTRALRKQVELERGFGLSYRKLGDLQQAEAHLRKAKRLCERGREWRTLWQVEWELGSVLGRSGQTEEALALLDACYERMRPSDKLKWRAVLACEKARLLQALQRHEEALALLLETKAEAPADEQARVLLVLAEVYVASRLWEQALAAALEAEKGLRQGGSVGERVQVYRLLSDLYKRRGDFQRANDCQEQAHQLLQTQARQFGWWI